MPCARSLMRNTTRLYALLAAAILVTSAVGVAAVAAAGTSSPEDEASNDTITVTVTDDGEALDGATVEVVALNGSYVGEGTYTTDDGTVTLPRPDEPVEVELTVTTDTETETTTTVLRPAAEATPTSTATPSVDSAGDTFGDRVSEFVHGVLTSDTDGPPGQVIASWVVQHNPGQADSAADGSPGRGPEIHNGDDEAAGRGPPEYAGRPGHVGDDEDEADTDESDEDDEDE